MFGYLVLLLHVADRQALGHRSGLIIRQTLLVDLRVVRANDEGNAVASELLNRMGFIVGYGTREPVADRADLDANGMRAANPS